MVPETQLIKIIRDVLDYYASFKLSYGETENQLIIDEKKHVYELKIIGWKGSERIYGTTIHLEIKNELVWIHYDGTEDGVALKLEEKGIPKKQIVLGWLSPFSRKLSDYASVWSTLVQKLEITSEQGKTNYIIPELDALVYQAYELTEKEMEIFEHQRQNFMMLIREEKPLSLVEQDELFKEYIQEAMKTLKKKGLE